MAFINGAKNRADMLSETVKAEVDIVMVKL